MQVYLVGGAVRDALLGLPITEQDWVVVGSNPEEMIAKGFKPVGKDFPVFLHPLTYEEYALARTERKSGKKHGDFIFIASSDVSLEEDLIRRDLTINAIAQDTNGHIIDPYGGQNDIKQKLLRHVSQAFSEDPLRILRVARFMAKFAPLGFRIAPETLSLMKNMTQAGELSHLSQERIWKEIYKALISLEPSAFFDTLAQCDALNLLFPGMTKNGISAVSRSCKLTTDPIVRYASALYEIQAHIPCPKPYSELQTLAHHHHHLPPLHALSADEILIFISKTDGFRRPERFAQLLLALQAITTRDYSKFNILLAELQQIDITDLINQYNGVELATSIRMRRLDFIKNKISL